MPRDLRIKICGLRDPLTARTAVAAGADCVGLVFVPASPRFVADSAAQLIAAAVRPAANLVGVFRDESPDDIAELARDLPLDEIQLHGEWTEAAIESFAPIPVVRAVSFDLDTFAATIARWDAAAARLSNLHAVLVDTPDPTKLGGGTGRSFDWSALRLALDVANPRVPIILAGGLNPSNVADAIAAVRPHGVDVSSGVESSRGVKDPALIAAFIAAARSA